MFISPSNLNFGRSFCDTCLYDLPYSLTSRMKYIIKCCVMFCFLYATAKLLFPNKTSIHLHVVGLCLFTYNWKMLTSCNFDSNSILFKVTKNIDIIYYDFISNNRIAVSKFLL